MARDMPKWGLVGAGWRRRALPDALAPGDLERLPTHLEQAGVERHLRNRVPDGYTAEAVQEVIARTEALA